MVRSYELSLVISPEVADDRIEAIKEQLKSYITDRGGEPGVDRKRTYFPKIVD